MLDLTIVGGTVIAMDPERRVLRGGVVGIEGGKIALVGGAGTPVPDAGRRIDARGRYVLPGFVDTHGHAGHSLTRGLGEGRGEVGADGELGWGDIVGELYFRASDDGFWRAESRLAALERLRFGVTTSLSMTGSSPRVDDPRYALAAASGYEELGLRHVAAAGPPNGPWPLRYTERNGAGGPREVTVDLERALGVTEECIQAFAGVGERTGGRVRFFVGPSAVCPGTDPGEEFARAQVGGVMRLVERYGTGFHAHAYAGMVRAAYAIAPELFGPHACMAHCAGIGADEIAILARTGTAASHGPLTHAYVANRFGVIEALEAGVNVVVSTDGSSPDRNFDLLGQARIAGQLQRAHFADSALLPAGKLLGMITIEAARALGMDAEVGSLEAGKRADVILLDARQAHLAPDFTAPPRVIGHASGHDVVTVVVDGRVLMEDRVVAGVDEGAILDGAETAFSAAWERTGFGDRDAQHPDTWFGVRYR